MADLDYELAELRNIGLHRARGVRVAAVTATRKRRAVEMTRALARYGDWAVTDPLHDDDGVRVTHLPTGMGVSTARTLYGALVFAREAHRAVPRFDLQGAQDLKVRSACSAIAESVKEREVAALKAAGEVRDCESDDEDCCG